MRPLVWFRSDLRIADNTALHHAAQASTAGLVAVFVVSPAQWARHDYAPARVDLILRTLAELSAALTRLHVPLRILHADHERDIPAQLLALAQELGCHSLHFNREYEVDESARDAAVTHAFHAAGLAVHAWHDQVAIAPGAVRTAEGSVFTVFTPFKRRWIQTWQDQGGRPPLPTPQPLKPTGLAPSPVLPTLAGFESTIDPALWPAGEQHALQRLKRFAARAITTYKQDRDFPALDHATSQLSPYLAVGALSPRQCVAAALDANASASGKKALDAGNEGAMCWISEVIWREFYVHVLAGFPRVCKGRAFQPATDRIRWSTNHAHFEAWCQGKTGVPIVDAAMRQLRTTGWMHNRLRMVAAMYLTKDLFIDWRWGERFFMKHLVDGFFASNNGGWQWSASTGTDAAPYFRIFNPHSQSEKFDAQGAFIRRYVPELQDVQGPAIHDVSQLPELLRARLDYPPKPIVDHAAARARVLEAFKAVKGAAPDAAPPSASAKRRV